MIELNSEAQCKTLKYRADLPTRFGSLDGLPTPCALPTAAWINPSKPRPSADGAQ
jgi:hypothetical protein